MIHVKTPEGGYPIFLEHDGLSHVGKYLQNAGFSGVCAVVTNTTVEKYYAEKTLQSLMNEHFQPVLCEIPDGEEFKTLETAASLYDQFIQGKLDRKSPVLALGGGVVGAIAGFAGASFLRGVPFVQIPTTLLSMVDSSVGG